MKWSNKNISPNNFSERLQLLMVERGLVQESLAKYLGVSQGSVSGWLNGAVPQPRTLELIAGKLDTTSSWLREGGERPIITHGMKSSILREEPPEIIDWKRRALDAEKELAQIKSTLRKLGEAD